MSTPGTAPLPTATRHPLARAARTVREVLKSVSDVNPTFVPTPEKALLLTDLVALEAQVAELRLRVMASAADVAEASGDRSVATWLSRTQHLRWGDCTADLRLAESLERDHPLVADALRAGELNLAQARVVVSAVDELPSRVGAEAALVQYAAEFEPTTPARLGRRILDVVAPEVAEAEEARQLARLERHAAERQRLRRRALGEGTTRISAIVPDATAARLATYLHAFTNPRLADGSPRDAATTTDGATGADADPAGLGTAFGSPLTRLPRPRLLAEAFAQLLECLDPARLPIHGGDATTLTVTIGLDSLTSDLGVATLANGVPGDGHDTITAAQARRLACSAQIIPAVLGADSELLDLGRSRRLFSKAQRRALLLRDCTCRAEGCDIPGTWSEAHHLRAWSQGGGTDLDNAVLLCSHHHHRVHDPAYEHHRLPDGDLRFRRRP